VRKSVIFLLALVGVFLVDDGLKQLFLDGYEWHSRCISLELHINRGVAFSLFAFLGEWLKWLQVVLVTGLFAYFAWTGLLADYPFLSGSLMGAALGNLSDRFRHGGVVDYVYWHCGFDFAIFNFADTIIDLSIVSILISVYMKQKKAKGVRH